jgi:DNA recombination protein RmuC
MLIYTLIVISVLLLLIVLRIAFMLSSISAKSNELERILSDRITASSREDRKELSDSIARNFEKLATLFDSFRVSSEHSIERMSLFQKERLDLLEKRQNEMIQNTDKRLEQVRLTVEEKLDKTLSDRLGKSFETVGKQLIEVQKGLGEMQVLAQDVGGLKRVLSNVKMRGGIGEVQLSMLLENILAPDQYQSNVKTKKSGRDYVEFAIRLPGKETGNANEHIWLPVDAKFPKEYYESLQNAYDTADSSLIEREQRCLESAIKLMAKDISEKYIDPPNTTDFAIMFLPFEGIYAEVVRKASLLEEIQNRYKVLVTGPATFAAILNSLQMGFRTLAIEKRSGEVWNTLAAVKREFQTFGDLLTKAQKNIQGGLDDIDKLVGTRTRAIQRKLKEVETLEIEGPALLIPDDGDDESEG